VTTAAPVSSGEEEERGKRTKKPRMICEQSPQNVWRTSWGRDFYKRTSRRLTAGGSIYRREVVSKGGSVKWRGLPGNHASFEKGLCCPQAGS